MTDQRDRFTRRLLADAGLCSGMRVLDIGCGRGEVTRLLGALLGPTSEVVGVDRDPRWLAVARAQLDARPASSATLRYVEAELDTIELEPESFDALTCRRVLMYQPDPVATLRHLARALRPGGRLIIEETDATMVPASLAALPLHRQVHRWIWATVEHEGADPHIGFHLAAQLEDAGLIVDELRAEALVQRPGEPYDAAVIVAAIVDRIEAAGVATRAEIGVETLAERLEAEREAARATYVGDMSFGALARRPAS